MARQRDYRGIYGLPGAIPIPDYNPRDKRFNTLAYVGYMLVRSQKMFEYEGLPETIPARELELLIQTNGFACVAEREENLYAFFGQLGGEPDEYYRPTICVVSNPALNFSKEYKINTDCVIVRNDALHMGLLPLITKYSKLMVENELSMWRADVNARAMYLIGAETDKGEKAANKFLRDIEDGEAGAIHAPKFIEGVNSLPLHGGDTGLTSLIEYQQYLWATLWNKLGLRANYNMKREALNSAETELGVDALLPLIDEMLKEREEGVNKINEMFGTNISVRLSSAWEDTQNLSDEMQEENAADKSVDNVDNSGGENEDVQTD